MDLNYSHIDMMKHAWGYDTREPGYRSHYCTQVDNKTMLDLVKEEIFHGPHDEGRVGEGCGMYYLTKKGIALLEEWRRKEGAELNPVDEKQAARFKENFWEEGKFAEVTQWILENTKEQLTGWQWIKNSRCKYIELRIDMRDGGFIIKDRDGKRISFDQLKYQYKGAGE